MERTLVLIKPDAFKRGLVGEIISRFERVGLKLEGMKIVNATNEIVEKHYPDDKNWIKSVGKKTIDTYEKYNLNIIKDLGTNDALKIGKLVRKWLIQHLTSGPVLVLILSGNHAVEIVRKIVGTQFLFLRNVVTFHSFQL
jgi:nucleoside-diphosphate kinase